MLGCVNHPRWMLGCVCPPIPSPLTIGGSRCLLQIGGSAIAAFSVDAPGGAASDGSILANLSQGGLLQSVQSSPQWTSRSVQ